MKTKNAPGGVIVVMPIGCGASDCSTCNPIRTEVRDLGSKLAAQLLLCDRHTKKIVVPTREEWIGINLLSRDDELQRRK